MLKGKTAVVTGGTRGIGFAVVRKFLENGAAVALWGSRQETVDGALAKLRAENPDWKVIGMSPDLGSLQEVEAAMNRVKEQLGRVDILVNNAGISARESLYDYKEEDFEKITDLNLNAVFRCSKAAAVLMKEQGGGEFAEQILADLIKQGFSGDQLLAEFKKTQKKVRPAVEAMLTQAEQAARGEGESYSYNDVFGTEEK